ncbi:outer membrane beta-barrel protein [Flavitalea antarctica]
MSDHDFEKRVKEKMDELKFTPSDAVWQAVQMEIRKDKPRRRGWILIPLLVAGLGFAGYFIFSDNKPGLYSSNQKDNSTNQTESSTSASSKVPGSNAGSSSTTGDSRNHRSPEPGPGQQGSAGQSEKVAEDNTARLKDPLDPTVPATSVEQGNSGNDDNTKAENSRITKAGNSAPVNAGSGEKTNAANTERTSAGNIEKNNMPNAGVQETQEPPSAGSLTGVKNRGAKSKNKNVLGDGSKTAPGLIAGEANARAGNQAALPQSSGTKQQQQSSAPKQEPQSAANKLEQPQSSANKQEPQSAANKQHPDLSRHDSLGQVAVIADQHQLATPDSSVVAKPSVSTALNPDSGNTSASKLVKSRKNNKRWDWGLNISGGVSNINEGSLTGVLKSSHMADAASNAQSSGNSNFLFAPSISGLPPARSSEVNAGPYFSVGGFVTKQLSRTFSITAALQYSQFNTVIKVGYRVDSSRLVNNGSQIMNVARYYRADENSKFANKYHFIELPLTLSTRITGNKSIPVFWNAGVHLSQLIGSNALVFDSGTGVYYQDKSTLNKTQLGLSTGFTFGLFGKSKVPVLLGPTVRYNASQMFNKDILDGNHLISAGIDLRILLNKK